MDRIATTQLPTVKIASRIGRGRGNYEQKHGKMAECESAPDAAADVDKVTHPPKENPAQRRKRNKPHAPDTTPLLFHSFPRPFPVKRGEKKKKIC